MTQCHKGWCAHSPCAAIPLSRSSASARSVFPSSRPMLRSTSGAFVNCTSSYCTTCTWLPQGSRKSSPRPGRISAPARFERPAGRLLVVDDEAEMARGVGRLRAPAREGDELVAHVHERHPWRAPAQRELEDCAVEGERLVDVSHLECHVVDADEPRTSHLASVLRVRWTTAVSPSSAQCSPLSHRVFRHDATDQARHLLLRLS